MHKNTKVDWSKIKNFNKREIQCRCLCKSDHISHEIMELADKIREEYGFPIKVNSGVRCLEHNTEVGGAPQSFHIAMPKRGLLCEALDISPIHATKENVFELLQAVFQITGEIYGVIRYGRWIHVDHRSVPYRGRK